ncbi:hypothetical protein HMPREF1868_00797 [Olsenella sp. DNF00959]|nr:hypothetical protein HMPREF1868_00797 [Olsenella sp. DNF00959]
MSAPTRRTARRGASLSPTRPCPMQAPGRRAMRRGEPPRPSPKRLSPLGTCAWPD